MKMTSLMTSRPHTEAGINLHNICRTSTQVVTSHIARAGTGRLKGGFRSRSTALPSYHGRRGATRGENANSVTWHIAPESNLAESTLGLTLSDRLA